MDAKVNFGASKIMVTGKTTIEALEKAGAFENLKVRNEYDKKAARTPYWQQKENLKVYISAILLFLSWLIGTQLWIAIFADMGATLIVTLNSLRILKINE